MSPYSSAETSSAPCYATGRTDDGAMLEYGMAKTNMSKATAKSAPVESTVEAVTVALNPFQVFGAAMEKTAAKLSAERGRIRARYADNSTVHGERANGKKTVGFVTDGISLAGATDIDNETIKAIRALRSACAKLGIALPVGSV